MKLTKDSLRIAISVTPSNQAPAYEEKLPNITAPFTITQEDEAEAGVAPDSHSNPHHQNESLLKNASVKLPVDRPGTRGAGNAERMSPFKKDKLMSRQRLTTETLSDRTRKAHAERCVAAAEDFLGKGATDAEVKRVASSFMKMQPDEVERMRGIRSSVQTETSRLAADSSEPDVDEGGPRQPDPTDSQAYVKEIYVTPDHAVLDSLSKKPKHSPAASAKRRASEVEAAEEEDEDTDVDASMEFAGTDDIEDDAEDHEEPDGDEEFEDEIEDEGDPDEEEAFGDDDFDDDGDGDFDDEGDDEEAFGDDDFDVDENDGELESLGDDDVGLEDEGDMSGEPGGSRNIFSLDDLGAAEQGLHAGSTIDDPDEMADLMSSKVTRTSKDNPDGASGHIPKISASQRPEGNTWRTELEPELRRRNSGKKSNRQASEVPPKKRPRKASREVEVEQRQPARKKQQPSYAPPRNRVASRRPAGDEFDNLFGVADVGSHFED
jgi:hypothetical protein